MSSSPAGRSGNPASKAADRVENVVTTGVNKANDAANAQRGQAAGALDAAAEAVDRHGKKLPKPLDDYAGDVKDGLATVADYVRDHDVREMADQAAMTVKDYPVTALLVLGAVVLGGGLLVASIIRNENDSNGGSARQPLFASAADGLGPKATETVNRIRNAAFSMALAKTVDTIEDMFPGFREHFEKA